MATQYVDEERVLPVRMVDSAGVDRGSASSPIFVRSLAQTTVTATIANGASLSDAVDCGDGFRPVRIIIPASWTTANLTFQTSNDGVAFNDAYYDYGGEVTVAVGGASRAIVLPPSIFFGIRRFKVRSGTAGTPVNQGGARSLVFVVQGGF